MDSLFDVAIEASEKAAATVMKIYNSKEDFGEQLKTDNSPVTKADLASNKALITILEKTGIPILSEETLDDKSKVKSNKVWIIDPLDGTSDFLKQNGEFCIMLALIENNRPVLGIVNCPALDKLYYAKKGKGAYLRTREGINKLTVKDTSNLNKAFMVVSRSHFSDEMKAMTEKIAPQDYIHCGSNGLKSGLVAEAKADIMFNPTNRMGEWDGAAADIIVHESGGSFTDMNGELITYNKENPKLNNGVMVTNRILLVNILEALN